VNDLQRTTQVYRDVLGFTVEGETGFAADVPTRALTGLSNADVRRSRVQAPGSTLWIELVEYKGVERTPRQAGHGLHAAPYFITRTAGPLVADPDALDTPTV
jgi:hypothetical protein